ncbi:hypothetical protein FGO68_gene10792 [Halteria grandinella]|uniref:Uncharacterized protein n=1 Tax=Halteria grandinella TaxID=5974 RepID=A0A8J8NNH6_HALGN|nr:hypothetical protein FGO68_gene10792 [Halteria grandinella]
MSAGIANFLVQGHVLARDPPPVVGLLLSEEAKDHFKLIAIKQGHELGGKRRKLRGFGVQYIAMNLSEDGLYSRLGFLKEPPQQLSLSFVSIFQWIFCYVCRNIVD